MKKKEENTVRPAPKVEAWWHELKATYFSFHKAHFKDADGYPLSPDWNPQKLGMEASALKKIIIFLREISEGKKIDWTLEYATDRLIDFLHRAYADQWLRKNFYCAMLNKKKVDILCKAFNPGLVRKILEIWYFEFPGYARDYDKDKTGAEIIIGFLKQQYILASAEFTEESVLGTTRRIFITVKEDEFWCKKSLNSVARNLQEFVNRIKQNRNGRTGTYGSRKGQSSRNNDYRAVDDQSGITGITDQDANTKGGFGKL